LEPEEKEGREKRRERGKGRPRPSSGMQSVLSSTEAGQQERGREKKEGRGKEDGTAHSCLLLFLSLQRVLEGGGKKEGERGGNPAPSVSKDLPFLSFSSWLISREGGVGPPPQIPFLPYYWRL